MACRGCWRSPDIPQAAPRSRRAQNGVGARRDNRYGRHCRENRRSPAGHWRAVDTRNKAKGRRRSSELPRARLAALDHPRAWVESCWGEREAAAGIDRGRRRCRHRRRAHIRGMKRTRSRTELMRDQAAGSADRSSSLRRSLTLADLSWPQAARMSRPRGVRTGAEYPAAKTMSLKTAMSASVEHSKGAPGQGLNGIRLTLAGMPARSRTSSRASAGLSLTPFSITYSKVMRRALVAPG